tara:strand:+ start:727 stop:1206 length:480 start_codon:yes stop_codon:yes gene_type:complete
MSTCHVHSPPRPGRLYVLSNPQFSGVKIGMTTGRAADRARALSGTGVAIPFVVEHETEPFDGCAAAEKRVFTNLATHRVAANREFFEVTVETATAAVKSAVAAAAPALPSTPDEFVDRGRAVTVSVPADVTEITIKFVKLGVAAAPAVATATTKNASCV